VFLCRKIIKIREKYFICKPIKINNNIIYHAHLTGVNCLLKQLKISNKYIIIYSTIIGTYIGK